MKLDLQNLQTAFINLQKRKKSNGKSSRTNPSLWNYDYIVLSLLHDTLTHLLKTSHVQKKQYVGLALDLGCDVSPYKHFISESGYTLKTLDLTMEQGADYAGTVEDTGLDSESFDLVFCTEVLEHSNDPFQGMREIYRILKPGGHAIISCPHVWFYHPHPHDHWRFTQEGLAKLCTNVGFQIAELHSQGGSIACLFQIINFLTFGILGAQGKIFYYILNTLGLWLDHLCPNQLFCLDFACLAKKTTLKDT